MPQRSCPGRKRKQSDSVGMYDTEPVRAALADWSNELGVPARLHVRAEPLGADFVFEHRCVPGFGLALDTGASERAGLYWVQFGTLDRSDDFDQDRVGGKVLGGWDGPEQSWLGAALEAAEQALNTPLAVEVHRRKVKISAVVAGKRTTLWEERVRRLPKAPTEAECTFFELCSVFRS